MEKTAEELAREVKSQFDTKIDKVREVAEKATAEAKASAEKGEQLSNSLKEKADELLVEVNTLKQQNLEFEQKLLARATTENHQKTIGEQFTSNEEFKKFADHQRSGSSVSLEIKADITTATTGDGAVGSAIMPYRVPGVLELPRRRLTLRNLLMSGVVNSSIIEYVRETGFTNNAGMVPEGGLKPQSDMKLSDVSVSTKVIAHWFRTSKQALSDSPQISSLIDTRLLYGLSLKEDHSFLWGDGAGDNLYGIIPQATAYSAPLTVSGETSIDKIRLMLLQSYLAEYPANGIVMHPSDWAWIDLLKDTTGRYIVGNPQGMLSPTLWGLPVVTTQSMQIDKVLVGSFDMGAYIFDQWKSRVEVGFQNDDFTRNKVTILAEKRLALAVYRPESFIYGDFGRVSES